MPRYRITTPRYLNGQYIWASVEFPAEVELPEGARAKSDLGLVPVEEPYAPPKPAHVPAKGGGAPTAAELQSKAKRPSDRDV